ncbi:MAG: hypothetical protein NTX22_04000 [Ignavibacteriales bacterium]|nr:hypothetical protein [Ignavibacteriales bacterium]
MEILINILIALLLVATIFLYVYLIQFLKKSATAIEKLQEDVHQLKVNFDPVLSNLNSISDSIASVSNVIDNQVSTLGNLVDQVKVKIESLLNIDKKIIESFEDSPIADLYRKLKGASKGASAFWDTYKRK